MRVLSEACSGGGGVRASVLRAAPQPAALPALLVGAGADLRR